MIPANCSLIEFHSAAATITSPKARMMVARLDSQATSFQSQRDAGHELLRQLIRATLADQHQEVQLSHSASGSPQLMLNGELSRLSVSIAHSKHWLAAGLAQNSMIGVDIEINSHRRNALALAQWLGWEGSENDADTFPNNFANGFIGQWVLWEACAKCSQQSMLKKQNSGFAALQAALSKSCFGASGRWTGWRDYMTDEAHVAMALFADTASKIQYRELNPECPTPW